MIRVLALLLGLFAVPAQAADVWANQFLARTDSGRWVRVDIDQAEAIQASINSPAGIALYVHCAMREADGAKQRVTYLSLSKANRPFMGDATEVFVEFDRVNERSLGEFRYRGGGYTAEVDPGILRLMGEQSWIRFRDGAATLDARITLAGARSAIESIRCPG